VARVAGIYTMYVDDILVATKVGAGLSNTGSNGLVIGNYPPSVGLNGQIDDFIVRRTF